MFKLCKEKKHVIAPARPAKIVLLFDVVGHTIEHDLKNSCLLLIKEFYLREIERRKKGTVSIPPLSVSNLSMCF